MTGPRPAGQTPTGSSARVQSLTNSRPLRSKSSVTGHRRAVSPDERGELLLARVGLFPLDLARLVCIIVGEHLIHGYDIATADGHPWPIEPDHAKLVLYGYGPHSASSSTRPPLRT